MMIIKQRSIHTSKNNKPKLDTSDLIIQQSYYQPRHHVKVFRIQPLPSVLIDFIAMTVCDIIPPRKSRSRSPVMPELVYFIQKITYQAKINCRTALVVLIYLNRAKSALPKGAVGSYDTCHRMFLASVLLASKFLHGTAWQSSYITSNKHLSDICTLFSCDEMNQLERAFLKLIDYHCWVDDKEVDNFVLKHRVDFSL